VIDSISFGLKRGEIVSFLGPNGAGKTTTIKYLCRLINPTQGRIFIDGEATFFYGECKGIILIYEEYLAE